MNGKKLFVIALISTSLVACSGKRSPKVVAMKNDDKKLTCQDLRLEINEADFLKDKAQKTRGFSAGNLFSPWSYPSTYMNASKAITSSDERMAYLKRVYKIRACGTDEEDISVVATAPSAATPPNAGAPNPQLQHNFNYSAQHAAPYAAQQPTYAPPAAYGYAPNQPPVYGAPAYAPPVAYGYAPQQPAQAYGMQYQQPMQAAPPMGYGSRTNYPMPPRGYQSF